ncbi:uncharacterized protein [Diadema antillarum]|uniref:uncharacterized protein n=1 Tax=Diadema antillarum TaxID=105358 RepID=UPI003A891783
MAASSGSGVQLESCRDCRVVSTRKRHSSVGGESSKKVDFDFMGTLPDEIIIKILSYLLPNEVDVVGSSSRRLQELSVSASLARTVNLKRCQKLGMDKMKKYLKRQAGKIQVLNLSSNPWISAKSLEGMVFAMGAVTWLDVTGCCVHQRCLDKILSTAVHLKSLAFTDRAFSFTPAPNRTGAAQDQTRPAQTPGSLSKASLDTLSNLTQLRMVLTVCCSDLSLVVLCPSLLSLVLDGHPSQHFSGLRELCWTPALSHRHGNIPNFMKDVIIYLQDEGNISVLLGVIYNGAVPHLEGLNCALSCFQHIMESNGLERLPQVQGELPVVQALSKLKKLQELSLPMCALLHHRKTSIFDDEDDADSKNDQRDCGHGIETGQNSKVPDSEALASLTRACPYLKKLELIDSHTRVSLFSTDSPLHSASSRQQCTKYRDQLTDSSLPALASLSFLTHLTLAGLQNVRHGRGLVDITRGCGQLSYLSLANLGLQGDCTFLPALCEALKHATNLADFRLEHRYMSISSRLLQSLASCTKLRRLCLITKTGWYVAFGS